jgi:hypothetical protein
VSAENGLKISKSIGQNSIQHSNGCGRGFDDSSLSIWSLGNVVYEGMVETKQSDTKYRGSSGFLISPPGSLMAVTNEHIKYDTV